MPRNDDNHADQMNLNNDAYWESSSRGMTNGRIIGKMRLMMMMIGATTITTLTS